MNLQGLPTETNENTEDKNSKVLEIILSILSGILGTLLVALLVVYFIKSRSYNRQIKVLTQSNFGSSSDEMNKHIKPLPALPNTNIFANEKSNPGFMSNLKTSKDLDRQSIISSDSDDFAGIYDNPIFNISRKVEDFGETTGAKNPMSNRGKTEENDDSSYI